MCSTDACSSKSSKNQLWRINFEFLTYFHFTWMHQRPDFQDKEKIVNSQLFTPTKKSLESSSNGKKLKCLKKNFWKFYFSHFSEKSFLRVSQVWGKKSFHWMPPTTTTTTTTMTTMTTIMPTTFLETKYSIKKLPNFYRQDSLSVDCKTPGVQRHKRTFVTKYSGCL